MLPHGFSHDSRALHVRAGMPLRTSARSARARINRLPFYHKGIRRCKPAPLDGSDLLQGSHGAFILARAHDSSWLNARRLCTASPTGSRVSRYRAVSFVREETRGASTRPSSSPLLSSLFPVAFSVSVWPSSAANLISAIRWHRDPFADSLPALGQGLSELSQIRTKGSNSRMNAERRQCTWNGFSLLLWSDAAQLDPRARTLRSDLPSIGTTSQREPR